MFRSVVSRNHYQTLGVGFRATQSEIKSSFRSLAKKYHPDQNHENPAAEKQFREVKEAYECLSNKLKRAEYDRDFVRSGKVRWESKSQSSNNGSDTTETTSGELSRNELIVLYAAVIGMPFLASVFRRREESSSESQQAKLRESSWSSTPDVPEGSPRDELVRAFYNPLTRRWERLDDGAEPPSPLELFRHVVKEHRGIYQQIIQTDRLSIPNKADVFSVHEVPARLTRDAVMAIDRASGTPMFSNEFGEKEQQ